MQPEHKRKATTCRTASFSLLAFIVAVLHVSLRPCPVLHPALQKSSPLPTFITGVGNILERGKVSAARPVGYQYLMETQGLELPPLYRPGTMDRVRTITRERPIPVSIPMPIPSPCGRERV